MEREDGQGTAHTPTARDLDVLYRESDRLYYELARGCGLSDAAYWMLYEIVYCGGKATQRSLAQSFAYSRQTVNTAIKSLEAKGLVRLEFEEGSRKCKVVLLTEAGSSGPMRRQSTVRSML